jgi:ElaB/YqjD/DUF883 family membrane-anchored ribosome-binding protein
MQQDTMDKLFEDLHNLMADAQALVTATAKVHGEDVAASRSRTEQSISRVRERLEQARDFTVNQVSAVTQRSERFIGANPGKALGWAAGAGLLLGLLLAPRR